jgi:hypothetical protein
MILISLGLAALVVLLLAAEGFSRAQVATLKRLLAWVAALGGIALACLMLLTGRGLGALGSAVLFAPLVMSWWRESQPGRAPPSSSQKSSSQGASSNLSRAEALEILGLKEPATAAEIRAAHHRLIQAVHPDKGGSDWLASRLNQARATLLKR